MSKTTFVGVPLFTSLHAEKVTFNVAIDTSIFNKLSTTVTDFRFGGTAKSVTVPFEYSYGHIWLPVTINGKLKCRFILDSGASANFFHTSAIADLNLPREGSLPVAGMTGYEEVALVRSDSISIGSLTLLNQIAGSMDLSMFDGSLSDNQELGGILGYDFLSRFPVMVNYRESTLTVFNPDSFVPPPGGVTVDFHLTMLVPTISGELNGIKGDFMVEFEGDRSNLQKMRLAGQGALELQKVLGKNYNIPKKAMSIWINGARSFYLFIDFQELVK